VRFEQGDRVRCTSVGEDGFPLVRYGFVRAMASPGGPVVVMFDGEIGTEIVEVADVAPVSITAIELRLDGPDLLDDPCLRRGLTPLWQAEAESAGLDVDSVTAHDGFEESRNCWSLASLTSGGERYVLRAMQAADDPSVVRVRADALGVRQQAG
jgi:hypothetical protein